MPWPPLPLSDLEAFKAMLKRAKIDFDEDVWHEPSSYKREVAEENGDTVMYVREIVGPARGVIVNTRIGVNGGQGWYFNLAGQLVETS